MDYKERLTRNKSEKSLESVDILSVFEHSDPKQE